MKITALLPDKLIREVKKLSGGRNTTESITIALEDYIKRQRLLKAIEKVKQKPLLFKEGISAEKLRHLNKQF